MTCTVLSQNSKTNKSSPAYRWSQKCQIAFFSPWFLSLFFSSCINPISLWLCSVKWLWCFRRWWKQHWHSWKWQVWQAKLCTNWLLCLSLLASARVPEGPRPLVGGPTLYLGPLLSFVCKSYMKQWLLGISISDCICALGGCWKLKVGRYQNLLRLNYEYESRN